MIVLLNGASSAGKSSIAQVLQQLLPEPYLYAGVDHFYSMLPAGFIVFDPQAQAQARRALGWVRRASLDEAGAERALAALERKWRGDMVRTIAFMASLGNHLIVDEILTDPASVADYRRELASFDVLWVGLRCPVDILEAREARRTGRVAGQARAQSATVHAHCTYDLEVDTGVLSPYEAGMAIVERLGREAVR